MSIHSKRSQRMKEIKHLKKDGLTSSHDGWEYEFDSTDWRYWPYEGMALDADGRMQRVRISVDEIIPGFTDKSARIAKWKRMLGRRRERRQQKRKQEDRVRQLEAIVFDKVYVITHQEKGGVALCGTRCQKWRLVGDSPTCRKCRLKLIDQASVELNGTAKGDFANKLNTSQEDKNHEQQKAQQ